MRTELETKVIETIEYLIKELFIEQDYLTQKLSIYKTNTYPILKFEGYFNSPLNEYIIKLEGESTKFYTNEGTNSVHEFKPIHDMEHKFVKAYSTIYHAITLFYVKFEQIHYEELKKELKEQESNYLSDGTKINMSDDQCLTKEK